jgi:hypothetical protein
MNRMWLGLVSLGFGLLIFCADSTTDLSFFPKLYLTLFASKSTFLICYFAPSFFRKSLLELSYNHRPIRLPRFK